MGHFPYSYVSLPEGSPFDMEYLYEYFMENLKSRTVLDKFRSVTNFES